MTTAGRSAAAEPAGLSRLTGLAAPLFVVLFLTVLVVPMPAEVLDVLLVLNLAIALLMVFVATSVGRPIEFSVFPTLLLLLTLFRISLNVATTRMILTDGQGFGGVVIKAFGHWVVGGSYVVGAVVFLILIVIQFMVVTRGAERVAEVAARFRLDALPMKQMGIESGLSSGLIDEEGAAAARREVQQEIDFYGAMDGASRFIKGETMSAFLIVIINIVGGLAAGLVQGGYSSFGAMLQTYTLLTIGDGLVQLIPSLLVSTAAGIIITRSSSGGDLSAQIAAQVSRDPASLAMTLGLLSGLMLLFGLLSGVSPGLFLALGAALGWGAWAAYESRNPREGAAAGGAGGGGATDQASPVGRIHQVEVALGGELWSAWEAEGLLDRLRTLTARTRLHVHRELGVPLPVVNLAPDQALGARDYAVRLRGEEVARGQVPEGRALAVAGAGARVELPGDAGSDPGSRHHARWVEASLRDEALAAGLRVMAPEEVVEAQLRSTVLAHADELLGLQEVEELRRSVSEQFPAVAQALEGSKVDAVILLGVLRSLLQERVSVRNAPAIFEALVNHARATLEPERLADLVRVDLARQITRLLADGERVCRAIRLEAGLEEELRECLVDGGGLAVPPDRAAQLLEALQSAAARFRARGLCPVLLVAPALRRELWRLLNRYLPDLVVVSYDEVHPSATIKPMATVSLDAAAEDEETFDNVVALRHPEPTAEVI